MIKVPSQTLRLALHQVNSVLGDIEGNGRRILKARATAAEAGADLLIGCEMGLLGYPPEDLVLRESVMAAVRGTVDHLARQTADGGPGLLIGAPWVVDGKRTNAAILLDGGRIGGVAAKTRLPNYGVFDEKRIFAEGPVARPLFFRGAALGVMVCEDMWFAETGRHLKAAGAEVLVVLNASPFENAFDGCRDKATDRLIQARARVSETGLPLVYVNQVGGQDEIVFDGGSFVLSASGDIVARAPQWREDLMVTDWTRSGSLLACTPTAIAPSLALEEEVYLALVTGLGDYVEKNGFPGVVLGLSGGIDSALVAALAVDALGADRVRAFMLPSAFTGRDSLDDADAVARRLGIRLDTMDIGPGMAAVDDMLAPVFKDCPRDLTEENIQARLRGLLLMAVSNKFGPMLLSTGNKSETSVGYSTLYGDMCGGYAPLKDVYKTWVFALSRWRNGASLAGLKGPDGSVMPERVITKAPTAELRENQKDEDSLPPYETLDAILQLLVEGACGVADAADKGGFDPALVQRVWTMLIRAEYKRRQAPPGVKVTPLAFGRDRRYPMTNSFTG